jgi:hypothetical protein
MNPIHIVRGFNVDIIVGMAVCTERVGYFKYNIYTYLFSHIILYEFTSRRTLVSIGKNQLSPR